MRLPWIFVWAALFALAGGTALAQTVPRSATGDWIISETSSPVDYTPVVVAVTPSRDDVKNSAMELTIYCRSGRTSLVVTGSAVSGHGNDYAISYRINRDKAVNAGAGSPAVGIGVAFQGDVVRLLQSFPDEGELTVQLTTRAGMTREASFSLVGLNVVKEKVARACKWPKAVN